MIGSPAKQGRGKTRKSGRAGAAASRKQTAKAHRRNERVRKWIVNPLTYLPPAVNDFLARRVVEGAGVLLMVLAGFGIFSVLSWSIDDPSLNNATTRAPGNWMGLPGAYAADILLQTLGLACILLLLPPFVWGLRAFSHRVPGHIVFRVAAWLVCTLAAATFFGALPRFAFWPLALGLGGVLGDALAALGLSLFAPLTGEAAAYVLTALFAAPVTFFLALYATETSLADLRNGAAWLRSLGRQKAEEEETERRYPGGTRARRRASAEEEDIPRPRRPDVEPSRLRVIAWTIAGSYTHLTLPTIYSV